MIYAVVLSDTLPQIYANVINKINLCSGAFGKVYKGELLHSQGSGKKLVQTVAIKTIKSEL